MDVDTLTLEIDVDDIIIMSSDGLTNMVSGEAIIETVQSETDLPSQAETLVGIANSNGGLDNITVILVKFDKGDL